MMTTSPISLSETVQVGGNTLLLMAGPCSVESYEQTRAVAQAVRAQGLSVLRGGAFKPRTSPNSFQGLGLAGLKILRQAADEFGLLVISEALGVEQLPLVAEYSDIIQIGSRNMQHFPLLWAAGEQPKPVLLKRGFMSTIAEWLAAAEHIASRGNQKIILCERGIRSFDPSTRNVLDVTAIAHIKQNTPFPIFADPSHATGRADLVPAASRAALAAGADGLIVEVHPNPAAALSDGDQSLPLSDLPAFVNEMRQLSAALGRSLA
ncbi:MAG: 3-deoxy-7-phosphoheptulonate synthase [Anaerolineae bacterium CG_4_9_14_3_um_filter_57_17]|nr:3-deoxy-7-phosphoheptulonate synthase [bacterium]NCT21099.1 3-deoxy-7-phosphoheptulonate synthase [bacterium]OIO83338.1 MAG: 3-deoxy-7-phosphoheptulonate synthase [Anaerolineae bacterium CG2_30_57_67]PJB64522.1 MAG: 3-deoxy-7-phosphoheptulonate synthase [Anaerolineae bacterium CG_4_9_14_3_um_filter_57_17]